MKRVHQFVLVCGASGCALWLTASIGQSQVGAPKNAVVLQPTQPGTSQSGHVNISGTMRANRFLGIGAGLTNVTAVALALPYTDSTTVSGVPNAAFKLTNLGTGVGMHIVSGTPTGAPGITTAIMGQAASGLGVFGYSDNDYGIYGLSNASHGAVGRSDVAGMSGVYGSNNSANGYGVSGISITTGVLGRSSVISGVAYGVRGEAVSPSGAGVYGENNHATSSSARGVWGQATGTQGRGVYGLASSSTGICVGVEGDSSSAGGRGVYGVANSLTGVNFGVYGISSSPNGYGVYGISGDINGTAIFGESSRGSGVTGSAYGTGAFAGIGVHGNSASDTGRGVYGHATALTTTNFGVYGQTDSLLGLGVFGTSEYRGGEFHGGSGESNVFGSYNFGGGGTSNTYGSYNFASSNTNFAYGAYGIAQGSGVSNYGFYGVSNSTTNTGSDYGVFGTVSDDVNAFGVYGTATSATGVVYGVRGVQISGTGFGLYAAGDTGASGTKSFVIDHPADPLNKYLRHYSMEAPKPWNLYRGKVSTDGSGYAMVDLPSYFDSINIEPTVHLTVNDDSDDFVQAKVVGGVKSGKFRIRTSKPNVEVAWLVIADRNDPWVRAHPTKDEYEKPRGEKGKLQAPEVYGYPKEMGVDYQREAPQQAPVVEASRPRQASRPRN